MFSIIGSNESHSSISTSSTSTPGRIGMGAGMSARPLASRRASLSSKAPETLVAPSSGSAMLLPKGARQC